MWFVIVLTILSLIDYLIDYRHLWSRRPREPRRCLDRDAGSRRAVAAGPRDVGLGSRRRRLVVGGAFARRGARRGAAVGLVGTLAAASAERVLGADDEGSSSMKPQEWRCPRRRPARVSGRRGGLRDLPRVRYRKPPPVSWCERVRGGAGVVLDDVAAGLVSALAAIGAHRAALAG